MASVPSPGVLRLYKAAELGPDGYPPEWHRQVGDAASSIKVLVRLATGSRCVRCHHPYRTGDERISEKGEWSPCDERCVHDGPIGCCGNDGGFVTLDGCGPPLELRGQRIYARWRILTVHHLDGNKANCRWWNLAPLCQRCHLQIQGKVQMARVWPWEHSDWFKPYVAGYYAHVYLGEDLTREQTEARLDELLELERAG